MALNGHLLMLQHSREQPWELIFKEVKNIAPNYNITLIEWNDDQNHIHIQFKAHPNSELSKFINAYKSASSRLIKKEYPSVRSKLWKESFWSKSYCLLTTGGAPVEVIEKYIQSQGEKLWTKHSNSGITPNTCQQTLITKTFGCVRFIYNRMLIFQDRILWADG